MAKRLLLFFFDIAAFYVSLILALSVRYGGNFDQQLEIHIWPFSVIFILWLLVFYISNLYDDSNIRNSITFYSNLYSAVAVASILSMVAFYIIPFFKITPKTNLAIYFIFVSLFLLLFRAVINNFAEKRFKNATLIVGFSALSLELARFLEKNPQLGYDIKYIVDIHPNSEKSPDSELEKFGIIEGVEHIEKIIKSENINTVVVSAEAYQSNELINIFYKAIENQVSFRNLSSFYEHVTSKVPLGGINQVWFLENLSEGSKKGFEGAKRIFDMVFAFIMSIPVVIIVFPIVILLIKINSPGPIFYKQKRVGRSGRIFEMIKFRTMSTDAEKGGAQWATENDPRVTTMGKILRKTRIDELPQLWNIIRGEMSFVGPRAERPEFHGDLKANVPFYEERYIIKPGLTGWAQINFRYGSSLRDAAEKLQYDLYYIKNRSVFLDLGIILKTINIALRQAGR